MKGEGLLLGRKEADGAVELCQRHVMSRVSDLRMLKEELCMEGSTEAVAEARGDTREAEGGSSEVQVVVGRCCAVELCRRNEVFFR